MVSWFDSKQGQEKFLFSECSTPTQGPFLPLIRWLLRAFLLGIKWQGHEADHFSPYSSRVKLKSGAVASQPLCLSGVHRDNFMGGVGAKGRKYKGTKQNESEWCTSGKSGEACIFTWCMVHLPASVLEYVLTSLVKWEINIYRIWQYCSVKKITVCWNVFFLLSAQFSSQALLVLIRILLSYMAPLVMLLTWIEEVPNIKFSRTLTNEFFFMVFIIPSCWILG